VNVMGLSFGGPVSATFVGRHPDRARTLTLVDPAAEPVSRLPWYIRFPVVGPLLWQAMAVPTMAAGQPSDFYEPARWPDWVARYQPQVELKGFGRALRRTQMDRVGVSMDSLYAAAGRAQRPTLLIWGKEDHTVPIANAAVVRKAIPQADFHEIERAGHLPTMERTDIVNPLLIDFLRSPKR